MSLSCRLWQGIRYIGSQSVGISCVRGGRATVAHNKDNLLYRRRLQRPRRDAMSCRAEPVFRLIVLRISRPAIMAQTVTRLRDLSSRPYDDRQPPGSMELPASASVPTGNYWYHYGTLETPESQWSWLYISHLVIPQFSIIDIFIHHRGGRDEKNNNNGRNVLK